MGKEDAMTKVAEAVATNGTALQEKAGEAMTEKKEKDGVGDVGEDSKDDEINKIDMDKEEAKKSKISEEREAQKRKREATEVHESSKQEEDIEVQESKKGKGKDMEEAKGEAMEEEVVAKSNDEIEKKGARSKEEKEKPEEVEEKKGWKKLGRTKSVGEKATKEKTVEQEQEQEQKTPAASAMERPIRKRKSVKRLVESSEKEAVKEFHIEKGRGTALKDIPNVAYRLSKRKTDDTFKILHTILFRRRGKALQVKNNISQFSGFVWHDNEDKQKLKIKERLDKCVKEKLLDFCDVLDIPTPKANTRKEDIVAKLIDFLVAPYATTTELLAEKEQSSKGKKRKRVNKSSASISGSTPSKRPAKSRKESGSSTKREDRKNASDTEEELDEEKQEDQENVNGVPERSEDETSKHAETEKENESESESEDERRKQKRGSKISFSKKESTKKLSVKKEFTEKSSTKKKSTENSSKKESTEKSSTKESTEKSSIKKESIGKSSTKKESNKKSSTKEFAENMSTKKRSTAKLSTHKGSTEKSKTKKLTMPTKLSPVPKYTPTKSSLNHSKDEDNRDTSPKTSARKKKNVEVKKSLTPKKSASKEKTGKRVVKGKENPKEDKLRPSDDELINAISEILKEVDFNTATFTDILKLLGKRFDADLTPRKGSIKLMIQDELTKLADEVDDDEEDEGDGEN